MTKPTFTALYGNIAIPRGYCSECEGYAFVIDGLLKCCDEPVEALVPKMKRMSNCPIGRRMPSLKHQERIISDQRSECFYCSRKFGSTVWRGSKERRLRIHWDHVNPYVYSLDNRDQNFVAACHVCNQLKGASIFRSADEACTYLAAKWKEKGYSTMRPLLRRIHPETDIAKVLQPSLPPSGMV